MPCSTRAIGFLAVAMAAGPAVAADFTIRGGKLAVKDPAGSEDRRSVVVVAKEQGSDVPALGDPTVGGAVLTIVLDGGTASTQSFVLDAGGWSVSGSTGYRYAGPTGPDADPVKKVVLQRRASGTALVKLTLRGNVGAQALALVPPNPGAQAAVVLDVVGGDRYCTGFGGAASGTERKDTSQVWKIVAPAAEAGCPTTTTTTTVSPVCGDGVVQLPEECEPSGPGTCPPVPDVACGTVDQPAACRCCVIPGGAIEFIVGLPVCCDGSPCDLTNPFICQCPP